MCLFFISATYQTHRLSDCACSSVTSCAQSLRSLLRRSWQPSPQHSYFCSFRRFYVALRSKQLQWGRVLPLARIVGLWESIRKDSAPCPKIACLCSSLFPFGLTNYFLMTFLVVLEGLFLRFSYCTFENSSGPRVPD